MQRCKHGLSIPGCTYCREDTVVYVTGSGSVYHRVRDCSALASGRSIASDQGGTLSKVQRKPLVDADADGKRPCKRCW